MCADHKFVGPIFDSHDILFLIVPGSIGIVASLFCLSVSKGTFTSTELYAGTT